MRPEWCPDLTGARVLIVASGPSAKEVPMEEAKGKAFVVAINESWRLCRWADMLYACDGTWWKKRNGVPEFTGLRVSQDATARNNFPAVRHVRCVRGVNRLVMDRDDYIGDGRTSLFQIINLAAHAGPPRVIGMVGADMRLDYGVHWHGPHEAGLNNPRAKTIEMWREHIDGIADDLAALGITVLNLSPVSALKNYRKATLQEFLAA